MKVNAIQDRKKKIEKCEGRIEDLKIKLTIPMIEMNTSDLSEPQTVCRSTKCRKYVKLTDGDYVLRYPQIFCDPCYPVPKKQLLGLLRFGQSAFDNLGAVYLCQEFHNFGVCN